MHILNQDQIEQIKTDFKYRRELFSQKSSTLKILISKFSLPPTDEMHPSLLREICEIDYILSIIREIDYQDKRSITKLGVDWEPFLDWPFFECFLKYPQPVSDRTILHLMKSFPNLLHDIYKKFDINISEYRNEQDLEKVETLNRHKEERKTTNIKMHEKVSAVSNIFIDIPNIQWGDISIIRVEDKKIKFKSKEKSITYTLGELGFIDNRNKEPSEVWELFKLLIMENGQLPGVFLYGINRTSNAKKLSRLREQLRNICGIPPTEKNGKRISGSPIVFNRISKTYNTEFLCKDDFTPWRNTPSYRLISKKKEVPK